MDLQSGLSDVLRHCTVGSYRALRVASKPIFTSSNSRHPRPLSSISRHTSQKKEKRKEKSQAYNVTSVQVARCVACHPYYCTLKLARMSEATHRNVLDPILLDMLALLLQKIDNEVGLTIAWAKTVDSDSVGSPLEVNEYTSLY